MKISTLGSGTVARTLGKAWAAQGYEVHIGARQPKAESMVAWHQGLEPHMKVRVGSLQDAAAFGDVILLAINPWTAIKNALEPLAHDLRGKIIIDVSNNIDFSGLPKMAFTDQSMGEAVQSWLTDANVVKALNNIPVSMMASPINSGIIPSITWVSGNNSEAKQNVKTLLQDIGWTEVIDLGDIQQSRLQESVSLTSSIVMSGLTPQHS